MLCSYVVLEFFDQAINALRPLVDRAQQLDREEGNVLHNVWIRMRITVQGDNNAARNYQRARYAYRINRQMRAQGGIPPNNEGNYYYSFWRVPDFQYQALDGVVENLRNLPQTNRHRAPHGGWPTEVRIISIYGQRSYCRIHLLP